MVKKNPNEKNLLQRITLYEEDFYEKAEVKEKSVQLIVFRLVNEWYGLDILKSKEILEISEIVYLPASPKNIIGLTNLRGNILSVMDLKLMFGLPQTAITKKSRFIIVEEGLIETSLFVDEVDKVIEIPISKIDPVLPTLTLEKATYIKGECKISDKLIGILNLEKIVSLQ